MKEIMNITTSIHDLPRYADNADLKGFYRDVGLDGLEVMQAGVDEGRIITPADVLGVHMKYFTHWLDFWFGDEKRLLAEYDDWETCEKLYGGRTRDAIITAFRENLQFAAELEPEYLVFHVSDCTLAESMTRRYHYTDEQVIDAAAELVNEITKSMQGSPLLLFENLWYPGLTMLRPEITARLLDKVSYSKTGIMLDVGHLLHTNMSLATQNEAVGYVLSILDRYADLSIVKGIHLHQSLSGEHAREQMNTWKPKNGDYRQRYWDVLGHIYQIDSHKPFVSDQVRNMIARISPEYLVLEQISRNREEHEDNLHSQLSVL